MEEKRPVILVVEDEPTVQKLLRLALEPRAKAQNWELAIPSSPEELDALLDTFAPEPREIDVLLLDGDLWSQSWKNWRDRLETFLIDQALVLAISGEEGHLQEMEEFFQQRPDVSFHKVRKPFRLMQVLDTIGHHFGIRE